MMYWIISLIDIFITLYFACSTYIKERGKDKEYERYKYPLIVILASIGISFIPTAQGILLFLLVITAPISIHSYNAYDEGYKIKIKGFLFNRI